MRHQKKTVKLGLTAAHRKALLANQVCSLIEHQRIKTTLAKAKAVRPLAEKMVTLGKKGSLHARRTALAVLRQKDAVKKLFEDIAPRSATRNGGYTRIIKLGQRKSDSARGRVLGMGRCAASSGRSGPGERQEAEVGENRSEPQKRTRKPKARKRRLRLTRSRRTKKSSDFGRPFLPNEGVSGAKGSSLER